MSNDIENQIRDRLHAYTDDVMPGPALLTNSYRVSRRLRIRGHALTAATAAVVVAAGGLTGWAISTGHNSHAPATNHIRKGDQNLMKRPTQGGLAHDSAFLQQVRGYYDSWAAKNHHALGQVFTSNSVRLLSPAHVLWAGGTAVGKVAIVLQAGDLKEGDGRSSPGTALGCIVAGKSGQLKMVSAPETANPLIGFFADKAETTLVVPDVGQPAYISTSPGFDATGISHRKYERVQFHNGASVIDLTTPGSDLVLTPSPAEGYIGRAYIPNQPDPVTTDKRMPWPADNWRVGKADSFWPTDAVHLAAALNIDVTKYHGLDSTVKSFFGLWMIYGTTGDGTHIWVQPYASETASYIYAFVDPPHGAPTLVGGGKADAALSLPVKVRLPNGQGWVVGDAGATLQYRIGDGPWHDRRRNAALYPATATAVRVTKNGATHTVPLGR